MLDQERAQKGADAFVDVRLVSWTDRVRAQHLGQAEMAELAVEFMAATPAVVQAATFAGAAGLAVT